MITHKASELEFIGRIRKDGTGIEPVQEEHLEFLVKYDEKLTLTPLSLTEKTFIASNMSIYTVKIKEHGKPNT